LNTHTFLESETDLKVFAGNPGKKTFKHVVDLKKMYVWLVGWL